MADFRYETYFFHSFPRVKPQQTLPDLCRKGFLILESMLDNGLLLVPETYEWPTYGRSEPEAEKLTVTQRRICFTELKPNELKNHSSVFGPFSIVYTVPQLRALGALPVFYTPPPLDIGYLSGLASQLLAGLADSKRIVDSLRKIGQVLATGDRLTLNYRGRAIAFDSVGSDYIRMFIAVLFDSAKCDVGITEKRLQSLCSCFYPTENPRYNEPLSYYRQREWRIVHAQLEQSDGTPVYNKTTQDQATGLLAIDEQFFAKQLSFFDPDKGIGATVKDALANRCYYFKQLQDLNVISQATAIVVPDEVDIEETIVSRFKSMGIRVLLMSQVEELLTAAP
jgi:hypothetical protein